MYRSIRHKLRFFRRRYPSTFLVVTYGVGFLVTLSRLLAAEGDLFIIVILAFIVLAAIPIGFSDFKTEREHYVNRIQQAKEYRRCKNQIRNLEAKQCES